MSSIELQIRSYYEHVAETVEPVSVDEVLSHGERVRPLPRRATAPRQRQPISGAVAFSLAAAILLVLGAAAFLLRSTTRVPDVVSPDVTNTSVAEDMTTTSVAEDLDAAEDWGVYEVREVLLPFSASLPPDDVVCLGLETTSVDTDPNFARTGGWLGESCYVVAFDGLLYRTSDGQAWESNGAAGMFGEVAVSRGSMVSLKIDSDDLPAGAPGCGRHPRQLTLAHTTDAELWTVTTIPLGVPESASLVGCSVLERAMLTGGERGFLIMGGLHHEVVMEAVLAGELDGESWDSVRQTSIIGTTVEVVFESGATASIDLEATERWLDVVDFVESLGADAPHLSIGHFDSVAPFGWWSPDGLRWRPVVDGGPMSDSPVAEVIATADGFEVASESGRDAGISWFTDDGTSWSVFSPQQPDPGAAFEDRPLTVVAFGTLEWVEAESGMRYGPEGRPTTFHGDPVDGAMIKGLYRLYGPTGDLSGDPMPASGAYTDGTATIIPVHLSATRTGGLLVSPGVGGENWQWVPGPWPSETYEYGFVPFAVVPEGGFIANVRTESLFDGEQVTTYLSDDGVNWRSVGPPPYLRDIDSYFDVRLRPFADVLRADVQMSETHGDVRSWESTDGVTWAPSRSFEGGQVETLETDFGWVAVTHLYEGGFGLWVSADGLAWERIATPDGFNQLRQDGVWIADAGGTSIFLTIESESGSRTWIGRFTP